MCSPKLSLQTFLLKLQLDRFCRNGDGSQEQVQGAVGFCEFVGGQPVWQVVQLFDLGEGMDPGAALSQFVKWA
jgi:hypothetical protein